VRILELLAQNDIMDEQKAQRLNARLHHAARCAASPGAAGAAGDVALDAFSREREQVSASWQKWLMA
jgi:glutamate-ammonia-ligase adenylyltransferase